MMITRLDGTTVAITNIVTMDTRGSKTPDAVMLEITTSDGTMYEIDVTDGEARRCHAKAPHLSLPLELRPRDGARRQRL